MQSPSDDSQLHHFSFILPPGQIWFSPKEAAHVIGRSDQFVRDLFDNQKILGHQNNAKARKGRERRQTYQIHRDCLLLYLLETANYKPQEFIGQITKLISFRTDKEVREIQFVIAEFVRKSSKKLA